ncbi:ComEA family DNA-binding protein [Nitrincola schmidtii]|uniref:ComEA family DNA-binding protein n=1 Tax=Nitrincola schmidtii TaxID=1730894 RepID=UPI00124EF731|nr:helix-hairpin-helix domain-containing protein [Nitrincola schmidtii]
MKRSILGAFALIFALALSSSVQATSPIDINSATASEIAAALSGVGPAKAQAIVDYRTEKGGFVSIEELTQVQGIGPATLERNRDVLLLETTPQQ